MHKRLISTLLLVLTLSLACTREAEGPSAEQPLLLTKAANSAEGALPGGLLVKLAPGARPGSLAVAADHAVQRVFPAVHGKEEVERKYGLDRWYAVQVPPQESLLSVARVLEADAVVERFQFGVALERPFVPDTGLDILQTKAGDPVSFNDPLFRNQWFLYNNGNKNLYGPTNVEGMDVSARDAWRLTAGDPSIIVAIVDEGVKYTHPDLANNMWCNTLEVDGNGIDDDENGYIDDFHGYNFMADGPVSWGKSGDEGHATHVAGLVAAVNNNGIGVSSIAGGSGQGDGVRLMSCQIFSAGKQDNITAYAKAIKYAADNGASVLQCSFGENSGRFSNDRAWTDVQTVEKDALDYFRDPANANSGVTDGNIVVFSAGNNHAPMASYPGAYREFICVSAVGQDGLPGWYTNYGPGVTIASPGGDNKIGGITMLSTVPSESDPDHQDYGYMHGTSMATPVVSGIVALGLSYAKKLGRHFTRSEFESLILSSVHELDSRLTGVKTAETVTMNLADYKDKMGTGIIDAWKVLMNIEGTPFVMVPKGQEAAVDLREWFGDDAPVLTWLGIDIPAADREALGIEGTPVVENGLLKLTCTKTGCGRLTLRAVAGGPTLGSEDAAGGKEFARTLSLISRTNTSKSGGWL
ncbi:MAG: S8 family serine peptidase [Bacteroidales bacterium]|nr:S8 family serine peptidase [Bacteroidales bacterium]